MGLKANVAWIFRSPYPRHDDDCELPNDWAFNHTIARVEDGTVQWLNGTNPIHFKHRTQSDIAGRQAYVAAQGVGWLEKTPDVEFQNYALGMRTTAGVGFHIFRAEILDMLLLNVKDRISDLWVGEIGSFEETYFLEGMSIVGQSDLSCQIKSRWVNASRKVSQEEGRIKIWSRCEILRRYIRRTEFGSESFLGVQKKLRHCFLRSAVIVSSWGAH